MYYFISKGYGLLFPSIPKEDSETIDRAYRSWLMTKADATSVSRGESPTFKTELPSAEYQKIFEKQTIFLAKRLIYLNSKLGKQHQRFFIRGRVNSSDFAECYALVSDWEKAYARIIFHDTL